MSETISAVDPHPLAGGLGDHPHHGRRFREG